MLALARSSLLLAALAAPQGVPRPAQPARPSYPYELVPLDSIYGHLAEGRFEEPVGIFFESVAGELYVADSKHGRIGIYNAGCIPLFAFGGPALLVEPRSVWADADGSIYVLDSTQTEVRCFSYRGEPRPSLRFLRPGDGEHAPAQVKAFARDAQGRWYVADQEPERARVYVYDRELVFVRELEPSRRAGEFRSIADLAVSAQGAVAVVDQQATPAIHVYDPGGTLLAAFGEHDVGLKDFTAPIAATFDEEGFLYAVDLLRHDVKIFTLKGDFVHRFGGWIRPETRGRGPGELLYPMDIAVAPGGAVYVAERYGQRVQAFERKPRQPAAKPEPPAPK